MSELVNASELYSRPSLLRRTRKVLGYTACWAAVAVPVTATSYLNGETSTNIASFSSTITPTTDGHLTLDLGPVLPNFRTPVDLPFGVGTVVDAGNTRAVDHEELMARIGSIASQPSGEFEKIKNAHIDMLADSSVKGALFGLMAPLVWGAIGASRRKELLDHAAVFNRNNAPVIALGTASLVLLSTPAISYEDSSGSMGDESTSWNRLTDAFPELKEFDVPENIEIDTSLLTQTSQNLVRGTIEAYEKSTVFYDKALERVDEVAAQLRTPEEGEVVVLHTSDRHNNIGMDPVAAAIGKSAQASIVVDTGDHTSNGQQWEAYSLDSFIDQTENFDEVITIQGNHDHGDFVGDYLEDNGKIVLDHEIYVANDIRFLGAPDPRSSGFTNSKNYDAVGVSGQAEKLADIACESDTEGERINILVVHDANSGREALARGCVDLVLSGHEHVSSGPEKIIGTNGKTGYRSTNGSTGGAAYAIGTGKIRRPASVSSITFRDGRPVGTQGVELNTNGKFEVGAFTRLHYPTQDNEALMHPNPVEPKENSYSVYGRHVQ